MKQQDELLNTTDNKQLMEFIKVDNTPFTIVKHENVYYGVIGNHRITEGYDSEKEIKKELEKINWDRLVQVIWAIVNKFKNLKTEENE